MTRWPFDDVRSSVNADLPEISHYWPWLNPFTYGDLPVSWWARYVLELRAIRKSIAAASNEQKGGRRG